MHKVMIVGDGRLGKTSLLRALRGKAFNENKRSTRGAKVVTLTNKWVPARPFNEAEIMAAEQTKVQEEQLKRDRHKAEEAGHKAEQWEKRWVVQEKWEQNSESASCRVCDAIFGILRRRHHCRKCGQLVCDKCSKYAQALAHFSLLF